MIASPPLLASPTAPAASVNRLALIGASGFIGLRVTEVLVERPDFSVTAVVRLASSLAVLARRPLPWKISSFTDEVALAAALRDTDTCVHAAIGDPAQIVRMATAAYRACAAAGVARLVWLSSATVHGQNCAHGSDENSPLHDRHPLVYPNAKVRAEWALQRLSRDGRVTVIMLRPGIVFGPRSRWIADAAAGIQAGTVAWHNGGLGVCNTVYIDNLVEAIRLAATVPGLHTGAFYVGDAERVTWRDFLLPIAWHLGRDESAFTETPAMNFPPERESVFMRFAAHPAYHAATQLISDRTMRGGRL
jgi:nucleoside-diphosphate-sugar epimerase